MNNKKDPYASEAETQALLVPDTRTAAERKLDRMLEERGASEQGAESALILRQIAVVLLAEQPAQRKPLAPVDGDLLPAVGSQVLIHLASQDEWVEHTVVGYYVWGAFDSDSLHRVSVRVQNSDGILNARMLCDVRPIEAATTLRSKT